MGAIQEKGVKAAGVTVRHCRGLEEFQGCLELEKRVWGAADIDVVPLPVFVVVAHTGGQVLGAFDGERLVGFTLAMPGFRNGRLFLHSHMTAVAEGFRDRGAGRALKLFQRQDALSRGIDLVEWTFDPLELRNAYFNLERLGAIGREFLPNVYGITTSPLHAGMPTDRLVVQWWLRSARVEARARGEAPPARRPDAERISVPANIGALKTNNPAEAVRVQAQMREQFQQWLGRGYAVTGIEIGPEEGVYLLEPVRSLEGIGGCD